MKRISSQLHNARPAVPISGDTVEVQFHNGAAIVNDQVAAALDKFAPFYQITGDAPLESLESVLLIRRLGLGDVLLLTPLIRALAAAGVAVDVMTSHANRALFFGNLDVRATYAAEIIDGCNLNAYSAVLDLSIGAAEDTWRTGQHEHRIDSFAGMADVNFTTREERHLSYYVSSQEAADAKDLLTDLRKSGRPIVAYVSRTHYVDNRTWKPVQRMTVIEALKAAGFAVLMLGVDHESTSLYQPTCDHLLNMTGRTSIRQAGALIAEADLVLAPDTGLFHVAGALDKPTVAYFGAFPVEHREAHTMLKVIDAREKCGLFPCRQYHCLNRDENRQARCLDVAPAKVVAACTELLAEAGLSLPAVIAPRSPVDCHKPLPAPSDPTLIGRAAVFCTAAIDTDPARYQAWADYYTDLFSDTDIDLYLFNDGPYHHKINGAVKVVHSGGGQLGRTEGGPFPGWKRSMGCAVFNLSECAAIAHVESDLAITPKGKTEFLEWLYKPGFYTGWCLRHRFPETALQILNTPAVREWYINRYFKTDSNWRETFTALGPGQNCFEHLVQRDLAPAYILEGDRYEGDLPVFSREWDYVAQCRWSSLSALFADNKA